MLEKSAIIIGAGPAGLTAAYELLLKTDIRPIIYESTGDIGGISKTSVYKGNRIDIGGHRFFSKSASVMQWWQNIMPVQVAPAIDDMLLGRPLNNIFVGYKNDTDLTNLSSKRGPDPENEDAVLLIRNRLSRILYLQKFFDYPVRLNKRLLMNLGMSRITKIGVSYVHSRMFPIAKEQSLEDFFINRFGRELYRTFFKDYTEKVWGVPCDRIKPEWGSQRVKGLSVTKALVHAIKSSIIKDSSVDQRNVETSLIERFLYPKHGPGQLWEEVAKLVVQKGGEINLRRKVVGISNEASKIDSVTTVSTEDGTTSITRGDFFFSSMPVRDLVDGLNNKAPERVAKVAGGLLYRDFLTVGLLAKSLKVRNQTKIRTMNGIIPDNWIYVQEPGVRLGRIQIFNNWSPYLVADRNLVWLGLEYFCNEGDEIWSMEDSKMIEFAASELAQINFIDQEAVLDGTVIRMPKAYPSYSGSYEQFDVVREYLDTYENLFLIGRNGMHKYNNADHSMLTAMRAVQNIVAGRTGKDNIWAVNTDDDYHEEK